MRPKERRESGQNDLFRARLDQIVDMGHSLAKLARRSTGGFSRRNLGRSIPTGPDIRRCRAAHGRLSDPEVHARPVGGTVRPVGILQRNTRPSAYHPRRVFAGNAATVLRGSRKGAKDGGEFAPGCSRKRGRATAAECGGQGGNGRDGLGISVETLSRRLSEEGTSSRALLTNCAKASRSGISRKRASWWRRSHSFWVTSARRRSNELQATRRYRRFCAFRPHSAPGASIWTCWSWKNTPDFQSPRRSSGEGRFIDDD
jgi:hypothetical protein